jgi:hypothetical protein
MDILDQKSNDELLRSLLAELAKSNNELKCARQDLDKATGRLSSDIGFLSPTLLKIDLGPLSYLGYVSNLAVNHIGFSKGMIPIRTDVSLQFNLMATAGLAAR